MGCCGSKSKESGVSKASSGHSKDKSHQHASTKEAIGGNNSHSPRHAQSKSGTASGTGSVQGCKWIKCRHGDYPAMRVAVKCSSTVDPDGSTEKSSVLVARVHVGSALVPGYFDTRNRTCFIAWGGKVLEVTEEYEILIRGRKKMEWVPSKNGYGVRHAVLGGHADDGEQLFVGRAGFGQYNDEYVTGRLHPSHKRVYVPHQGVEVSRPTYEILLEKHY